MKKYRTELIMLAVIIIVIVQLTITDFTNLSWPNNTTSYLFTISMLSLIISLVISNLSKKDNR